MAMKNNERHCGSFSVQGPTEQHVKAGMKNKKKI